MKILIGDIFQSKAVTLVNTVNCVGIMGKGIAETFKKKYPQMFQDYKNRCEAGQLKPGRPYYYHDLTGISIINFPTKDHWRSSSKLSYIKDGLAWFVKNYQELEITSIAFPPLGCGNGGLTWDIVGPIMYQYLHDLPIEIEIYAPFGTKESELTEAFLSRKVNLDQEIIGSKAHAFNPNWYAILEVIAEVNSQRYVLPVGRTILQKICFILTREGIDMGFSFGKGTYGPYCKEVEKAVTALANMNMLMETRKQNMIRVDVTHKYVENPHDFSEEQRRVIKKTVDLFCRVQNTDHAELISTIIYSYDKNKKEKTDVSMQDLIDYILAWKRRWAERTTEIENTVQNLVGLKWMQLSA